MPLLPARATYMEPESLSTVMPRGSLICEMRAMTRRLTGLKISIVLVPGRVITTWPLAMVTWLKPGLPGRSMSATWRNLACRPNMEQLSSVIKRINLMLRIRETGTCRHRYWDASSWCSAACGCFNPDFERGEGGPLQPENNGRASVLGEIVCQE